jgi:hypothetical protein
VDERSETFDADLYLNCRWHDPRLAFHPQGASSDTRTYQGDAAADRLEEIWWPDLEFVNTSTPQITNRTLVVHSDGTIDYRMGVSSTFRATLDLRRFPFDDQDLEITLQSFEADQRLLVFETDPRRAGFDRQDDYAGLAIDTVDARTRTANLEGWNENFSELVIRIHVERSPSFYLWTIFVPLTLVLLLSCTIFFVPIEGFHDRIAIALACFLACIATQFAMSQPAEDLLSHAHRPALPRDLFLHGARGRRERVRNGPHAACTRATGRTDRVASWSIPLLRDARYFVVLP